MKYLFFLFFLFALVYSYAQERERDYLQFGNTEKTSNHPKYDSKKNKKPSKRVLYIVKNDGKKALLGNACFEEYLDELGIRYQIQTSAYRKYNEIERYFHNVSVRAQTTLRKGPFWRFKLVKKRKECRELLHDYMG